MVSLKFNRFSLNKKMKIVFLHWQENQMHYESAFCALLFVCSTAFATEAVPLTAAIMSTNTAEKRPKFDPSEYELRKRLPPQMSRAPDHVYVNLRTNFKHQLNRAKEILLKGGKEVHVHGIGAAINRAINIALQVSEVHSK